MSFKTYEQIQFATSIYVPRPFTWVNYTGLWVNPSPRGVGAGRRLAFDANPGLLMSLAVVRCRSCCLARGVT
jgi:hypothetical protein